MSYLPIAHLNFPPAIPAPIMGGEMGGLRIDKFCFINLEQLTSAYPCSFRVRCIAFHILFARPRTFRPLLPTKLFVFGH